MNSKQHQISNIEIRYEIVDKTARYSAKQGDINHCMSSKLE